MDRFLSIDLDNEAAVAEWPANIVRYGLAVARAASDLSSRLTRYEVLFEELKPILETEEQTTEQEVPE